MKECIPFCDHEIFSAIPNLVLEVSYKYQFLVFHFGDGAVVSFVDQGGDPISGIKGKYMYIFQQHVLTKLV